MTLLFQISCIFVSRLQRQWSGLRGFLFCFDYSYSLIQSVFSVQEQLGVSECAALDFSSRLVFETPGFIIIHH